MKTVHRRFLEYRCNQRCFSMDEVAGCVVSKDGDIWTIDTSHPDYPSAGRARCNGPPGSVAVDSGFERPHGPGTELKKLLRTMGITAAPNCSCNKRARIMDEKGVAWCEANVDEIVGWLREEATKRKLPFVDLAGRALVNLAIRRAKKGNHK